MIDEPPPALQVFEDSLFTLDHADTGLVPGYLILRLQAPSSSWAELSPETARALGEMLSRATAAIEDVTGAERVYCLSFGEIDRRLHFHLFPRTKALLEEYWQATATRDSPVNGPLLFEWARTMRVSRSGHPHGVAAVAAACEALRMRLATLGESGAALRRS